MLKIDYKLDDLNKLCELINISKNNINDDYINNNLMNIDIEKEKSLKGLNKTTKNFFVFETKIKKHMYDSMSLYQEMLDANIAKECARFILPLATTTRIYMSGSCRSWIHYIDLRSGHGTQLEHMNIANACKEIFVEQFPTVAEALNWK